MEKLGRTLPRRFRSRALVGLEALELKARVRHVAQAIRVSLPWNATNTDVEAFSVAYRMMVQRLSRAAA